MKKENYIIRLCRIDEYDKLINFLKNHWKENHIFVQSKEVLDFQHLDEEKQVYNFIVAHNEITKEFDAVLGFIPTSQYDKNLSPNRDFWGAIWKVKETAKKTGIGLGVFVYFVNYYNPNSFAAIGISDVAARVYKAYKYKLGELLHFYIQNLQKKDFRIAYFYKNNTIVHNQRLDISFKKINRFTDIPINIIYPYKSINYIKKRYQQHPTYRYYFMGIYENEICKGVFIFRKIEANNAICLRIVDYLGNFIPNCYYQFQKLLYKFNAEYIDFLCYYHQPEEIIQMGFSLKKQEDKNIIPNYFEPFEKKNISIKFAYKTKVNNYAIFKGDSDQDRPNIIKKE
ncbi:hypothetical protein F1P34_03795 [Campylobacter coli]|uniref:GNAT family N-acetyltransferase n=1 Tax=Campylobacter coli TaxID=195 RepID=A0A6C7TL15_CAMCO|nr:hypothetical protein [Campylobacter coli]